MSWDKCLEIEAHSLLFQACFPPSPLDSTNLDRLMAELGVRELHVFCLVAMQFSYKVCGGEVLYLALPPVVAITE